MRAGLTRMVWSVGVLAVCGAGIGPRTLVAASTASAPQGVKLPIVSSVSTGSILSVEAFGVNDHPRPAMTKSIVDFVTDPKLASDLAHGVALPAGTDMTGYVQTAFTACTSAASDKPYLLTGPKAVLPVHGLQLTGRNCHAKFPGTTFQNNSGTSRIPTTDVFDVTGSNNVVDGAVIDGNNVAITPTSTTNNSGIVDSGEGNLYRNLKVFHNPNIGLLAFRSSHVSVENSIFYQNGLRQPSSNPGAGVSFSGVQAGRLEGNLSWGNAAEGFAVDNGTHGTAIIKNRARSNGVTGCFGGFGSGAGSDDNNFTGNVSIDNTCWGIAHQGVRTTIAKNVTFGNKKGGIYDSYFAGTYGGTTYPASELGHNNITGNTTSEAVSIKIDPGVYGDTGLATNRTNGVAIMDNSRMAPPSQSKKP